MADTFPATFRAPGTNYTTSLSFGTGLPPLPTVAGDMAQWDASVNPLTLSQPLSPLAPLTSLFPTDKPDLPKTSKFSLGLTEDGKVNWGNVGSLAETLGGLGEVWAAFQANKLAKDSLNFQKESYQTNLANQIASYNMALEDRAYARAAQNNAPQNTAQSYISQHKLG